MSTHKSIDRICAAILAVTAVLALLLANGEALGIQTASRAPGYGDRLFDTSRVHTIDIVMDDWDGFIDTCENEAYTACAVVIDGEAYRNVGIRAKGNTSLTTVSSMGSSRYSFKVEFGQYDGGKSYYGLDKLCLNNAIQDTTFMKDYLTYRMMDAFAVDAPLCSYAYLTVNGEDWGLYLAVEGVEEAFLRRNYGQNYGELYKPDSMSFGGGRGNGREFDMADFMASPDGQENPEAVQTGPGPAGERGGPQTDGGFLGGGMNGNMPGDMGGMGSSDVKLQYIDDDPESYANIFDNAKTEVSAADQARLIRSLKALGAEEDLEEVLDIEEVIRYFVVHNFVCNGDSYTGSMVHNYYLYEKDGRLSMIPWDYNLAFGGFQSADASAVVNSPLDSPVSGGDSRPMVDWIFSDERYTALYHRYFAQFLDQTDFAALIDETAALIAPYVEKDPTKFYSVEEFEAGVAALREFCLLREESAAGQLDGTIPSTAAGQSADASSLVDASGLTLSDMGTMNGGGFPGGDFQEDFRPAGNFPGGGSDGQLPAAPGGEDSTQFRPQGPEQNGGNLSGFPGGAEMPGEPAPAQSGGGLVLLAVSFAVLLAGLIIAFRFKR